MFLTLVFLKASETNEEELVESDVEFEGETVVDSDNDPPQQVPFVEHF